MAAPMFVVFFCCLEPSLTAATITGLHVPSFLQQCEEFWNTPLERVFTDVYMPFIGLYCIVCCVSVESSNDMTNRD